MGRTGWIGAGLAGLALMAAAGTVLAATSAEPVTDRKDNLESAVSTPIEDLNLKKIPIPEVLNRAVANPYDLRTMDRCQNIGAEVLRLDGALGPDQDEPALTDNRTVGEKRGAAASSVLRAGVEAVTPYRGLIRRVTGATAYEKTVAGAVQKGFARRGFLKGMAMKMNCSPPASPAWYRPIAASVPVPIARPAPRRR
jgi:hypothetical protein